MHLTDEQLNEYLDHETDDPAQIELHVSTCEDCFARLQALQELFSEIESLPELELEFAARFAPGPSRSARLPRSLTLTMIVQAALAFAAIIIAAPLVMQSLSPYIAGFSAPSFADMFLQLQSQWTAWLEALSTLSFPALPQIPVPNLSSLVMMFIVLGVSLLWLIGNGLLLRNPTK
jgi:hypothetical protein